jgi:hypothetical protein
MSLDILVKIRYTVYSQSIKEETQMTIFQGTILYSIIEDILVRNNVLVSHFDDLVSLINKLQMTFDKETVDTILLKSYEVIGFNKV